MHTTRLALTGAAAVLLFCGCGGDEEGTLTSQTSSGGANADGVIGDGVGLGDAVGDGAGGADGNGADGNGTDGNSGADSASGDGGGSSGAGADGAGADATSGPSPCAINKDCPTGTHCGLFYNGVKQRLGDDDGRGNKVLPGWANVCVTTDSKLATLGATCDPWSGDGDESLLGCHNPSACQQGTCTALCKVDADCPAATLCGASEVPVAVKDGAADAYVYLPVRICVPMEAGTNACTGASDCKTGEVCRPYIAPQKDQGPFGSFGKCVTAAAGKQPVGGDCGPKGTGKGLGKLCGSALCQYTQNGTVAGICTAMCGKKADCPPTLAYGGIAYKTACSSIFTAGNSDQTSDDDVFIPQCILINEKSSATDCAATKSCTGSEACIAFAIARGPEVAATVEHLCVQQATVDLPAAKLINTGAACDPKAAAAGCKGGYCLTASNATGYCSRTCNGDVDCVGGTKCKASVLIARKDATKAAQTKLCQK